MSRERLAALQELLHREVPLSQYMGVVADAFDGRALTLKAELEPNINIHGTAFGGSMYSLAALCGWALLRLRLEDLSLKAEIMLGSARIDYHRPVRAPLVARATVEEARFEAFSRRLEQAQRGSIEVPVALGSLRDGAWQEAALYEGLYATV